MRSTSIPCIASGIAKVFGRVRMIPIALSIILHVLLARIGAVPKEGMVQHSTDAESRSQLQLTC